MLLILLLPWFVNLYSVPFSPMAVGYVEASIHVQILAGKMRYNLLCVGLGKRMPVKIRKLKAVLSRAGFYSRSAKGSHTVWRHADFPAIRVTISGKDGSDAQRYQIEDVRGALRKVGKTYEA